MSQSVNWSIKSHTYGSCNCDYNCGCQFHVPSTHGFCQFVEAGHLVEGHFGDVQLAGLNWAFMMIWPGEIAEGNGRARIIIDERADADQREALRQIMLGEVGEPGSNHFSVFRSTCSEILEPVIAPIDFAINIEDRTAHINVPGWIKAKGAPIINEFDGSPFHIALSRPSGSFEFTYAEIGNGTAEVSGELAMKLDNTYGQFCIHHYDQNGLVAA